MKVLSDKNTKEKLIEKNSSDRALNHIVQGKDFLQSKRWREFQEVAGHKTYNISENSFSASIIEHNISLIGKYFYIPRGPIFKEREKGSEQQDLSKLIELAKKNNAGWIRVDINDEKILELIKGFKLKTRKAPHDMQPKQIFKINICGSDDELLSEMKPKTRYNIRLASKKGVVVKKGKEYIDEFLRLVRLTSQRQGITSHPEEYYRKMMNIPGVELYIAEFEGKVIVANIVSFYGEIATYLHGASDNDYRNVMAPFLLQWQTILDSREKGFKYYDFGGVKVNNKGQGAEDRSWEGITRFKMGFSKNTNSFDFLGSYDIVINPFQYTVYRILQRIKSTF